MSRILVGSRQVGVNNDSSDWDYVMLDENVKGSRFGVKNELMGNRRHCYHVNPKYREAVARFEIYDLMDYRFLHNASDYLSGLITINPFDYRDRWIARLKSVDFHTRAFYKARPAMFKKPFYHVIYNLKCLQENQLKPCEESMRLVKKFHDGLGTLFEGEKILEEIRYLE